MMSGVSRKFYVNLSRPQVKKLTLRRQHFFFPNQNVSELEKGVSEKSVGGSEDKEYEKYLGLPIVVGRNKKASLNYIKDRVWGKL